MRFNLRLLGKTKDGKKCRADITVYAQNSKHLQSRVKKIAEDADWHFIEPPGEDVPEGSYILVERVQNLDELKSQTPPTPPASEANHP